MKEKFIENGELKVTTQTGYLLPLAFDMLDGELRNKAIEKLKATVASGDTEAIKADTEALQKAFYPIAEKLYQQQAADGAAGADGVGTDANGDVYGADFEDKT